MKTGWLSPTGEWFPCEVYEHLYMARKLSGEHGCRADDKLIERGWVKISISHWPTNRWSIWWRHHHLTPEQKRFLKPYFAPDSELPVNDFERDYWEDECDETVDG